MVATNGRTVTVFGGTGFLGRRIVRHLRYREFPVRVASRHPDRRHQQFAPDDPQLQSVEANIHDERSVADALAGAYGVVNAVSLYLERVLLAVCIGAAVIAWQSPFYGDAARQIIARWAPQLVPTSSLTLESPGLPAQPSPPTVQAAAAKTAPPQPAPLAQTAPEDVAPTAAALSPESAQQLQSMARDLATVGQEIEQLKTSQEQMVRENSKLAEQLKASQEKKARPIAKASEQNLRPKTSAPPARPIATPTRKPVPKLSSPQATAQPQAEPVSRPLTPLR